MLFRKPKNRFESGSCAQFLALTLAFSGLVGCGGGGGGGSDTASNGSSSPNNVPATASIAEPARPANNQAILQCPINSPFSVAAPPLITAGVISGRMTFDRIKFPAQGFTGLDYDHPIVLPARGVVVEAIASSNGSACDGGVVATVLTDGDGWFQLTPATSGAVCVRARAQMYRASDVGSAQNWNFAVLDNTNGDAQYVITESSPASASDRPRRDLHAPSGWSNGGYSSAREAAPFAILDTACKTLNAALAFQVNAQIGTLPFYWSIHNTEDAHLTLQQGNIGSTHFDSQSVAIYLRGDADVNSDEFDEMVIAHEFGHFVTKRFSRSDSIGGTHSLLDIEDPRLSFDEGWATAFAGLVLETSIYRDSLGPGQEFHFDLQNPNPVYPRGWYTEASIQRILFTAGADNQFSGLGIGVGGLLQTFSGDYKNTDALASIFSYAYRLKLDQSGLANSITSLLASESIEGNNISPFAEYETHALTPSDLPIYKNIGVIGQGGGQVTVCSSNGYDYREVHKNALSIRRYLRLSIPNSASYSVAVQPLDGGGIAGLELLQRGNALASLRANNAGNTLTTARNFTAGTYVLGVFHAGFLDASENSQTSPQSQCFNVSVTMQ